MITLPVLEPVKQPLTAIVIQVEAPKEAPKEPTLDEKIASNFYKCNTDLQWIRADNAQCLDKSQVYTENASRPIKNGSGGGYSVGYCTAYAWSRRPDLPGNLGNADTWGIRAAAQGFTVNDTPSAGAIGVAKAYMHVVYIESVGDGTVYVSEQNYVGFGVVSYRTAPISEFVYIH